MLRDLYHQLSLIRYFEEESLRLANAGLIPGVIHPYTGHEAVAVGALAHRDPEEWVIGYYRCHGHALASGSPPGPLFREMLDRAGAICGGKSGSMHLSDKSRHFLGASSIVASQLSIGAGAAMSEKAARSGKAVVAFCGDGALGAGVAYETLMIAVRRALPLVLVCEDNGWQDHTPSEEVMPHDPATLLPGLGLPTEVVDGNEVLEVARAAESALSACRAGRGPRAVVAGTYLRHFHSQAGDDVPDEYRPADQVTHWLRRDPVELAADRIRALGEDPEPIRAAAVAEVDRALAQALSADPTNPGLALTAITVATWPEQHQIGAMTP